MNSNQALANEDKIMHKNLHLSTQFVIELLHY